MSSIGLCSKGLIIILWSELVLEGMKCIFGFVSKSLNVTSKHGSKIMNSTSVYNRNLLKTSINQKKASIQRSDSFFTHVMFFPDQDAIAGLHYKNYGATEVADARDSENKSVSHTSRETKSTTIVHPANNPSTSIALNQCKEYWTDSTNNCLHETRERDPSPVKRRGALEEMVLCLDGAVTSIDVCVLLLTCDRLTAPLLRAKTRGVRVRVLLDRSMATVEGSSLSQLRKGFIPVRLLPRDTYNYGGGGNTNNAASYSTHRTNNGNATGDGDAMLHHKPDIDQDFGNNFIYKNSTTTAAASSSGLMHHKFAVIDAKRKTVHNGKNLGQVRKEDNGEGSKGGLRGFRESNGKKGISAGITVMKEPDGWDYSHCHEGAAMVITGSCNWTWSAVTNNNENIIFSNRPELVVPFSEYFEHLWREAW